MQTAPVYDEYAFANKRVRPVSKETCITFQDYQSMSVHQRKQFSSRHQNPPVWALNDAFFRELLVRFMENRALMRPGTGTLMERLTRASDEMKWQTLGQQKTLKRLCAEYIALQSGSYKKNLAEAIEGLDTNIRISIDACTAGKIARLVYLYYRAGLKSPEVGAEVGMKPPHVRQTLWRLDQLWKREFSETGDWRGAAHKYCSQYIKKTPTEEQWLVNMYVVKKYTLTEIAVALGYKRGHGQSVVRQKLRKLGVFKLKPRFTDNAHVRAREYKRKWNAARKVAAA